MFTKEDYDNYFEQIARVERKMVYGCYSLGLLTQDPTVSAVLKKIGDDEVRHYGYVLKMLRLTATPGQSENRQERREYYLGAIRLTSRQGQTAGGSAIKAYCVNLSETGVCLECAQDLSSVGAFDLEIRLFHNDEVLTRRGRVVWSKEVEPGFYISGIVFDR